MFQPAAGCSLRRVASPRGHGRSRCRGGRSARATGIGSQARANHSAVTGWAASWPLPALLLRRAGGLSALCMAARLCWSGRSARMSAADRLGRSASRRRGTRCSSSPRGRGDARGRRLGCENHGSRIGAMRVAPRW